MPRPQADYAGTFNKLVKSMGVGKTIELSGPEIAQLIDEPIGRVNRMLEVMRQAGTLDFELLNIGRGGRSARYTLRDDDLASTEAKMKAKGLYWSQYEQEAHSSQRPQQPRNAVVRSFAEIAPLRKDEPRAQIEVARKYRDQQAFIAAQREKFKEMGLVMPEPSPIFDDERRRELDAIVRILPYIESIEKANANLEEQNRTIRAPMSELTELRSTAARQKDQIERLVREKGDIKDDVQRLMDDHKREVSRLKGEIETLTGQLRQIRGEKAINGAIQAVADR